MQIPPIPQLSHLVRHFLILESPGAVGPAGAAGEERVMHRLIPDGNPGIVFHYGAPFEHGAPFEYGVPFEPFPKSFAYGPITRPVDIVSTGAIGVFIVVLRPYGLSLLTDRPAYTLTNTVLSLHELRGGRAVEKQLLYATTHQQKLDVIQAFLLRQDAPLPDPLVAYSLQWLEEHEDCVMEELTEELAVSRRTLERTFQAAIGISPKQFAGILRTQHFLKALSRLDTGNITGLAYEFGYYDQSHLIRDFKTRTGITPGKYAAARDALALNFIQLGV